MAKLIFMDSQECAKRISFSVNAGIRKYGRLRLNCMKVCTGLWLVITALEDSFRGYLALSLGFDNCLFEFINRGVVYDYRINNSLTPRSSWLWPYGCWGNAWLAH